MKIKIYVILISMFLLGVNVIPALNSDHGLKEKSHFTT